MTGESNRTDKGHKAAAEMQENKKITQESFLQGLMGSPITVVTMDAKLLRGTLTGFDTFNIFIKQDGRLLMIPKHAIKYCYGGE